MDEWNGDPISSMYPICRICLLQKSNTGSMLPDMDLPAVCGGGDTI